MSKFFAISKTDDSNRTVGKLYELEKSDMSLRYKYENDSGMVYYCMEEYFAKNFEEVTYMTRLQFERLEAGDKVLCLGGLSEWWTTGKQYIVSLDTDGDICVYDDDNTSWYSVHTFCNHFAVLSNPKPNGMLSEFKDVANQEHYVSNGIEPIELMRKNFSPEEFQGFLQGNVLKYMLRYKKKNGLEDLKKAQVYLGWLIEEVEK